ncbi:hypothetical protein R1sor_022535 [Riccia sorocarpa]|uniref:Uncharacterized protein n=1 Tax=Riccia sorocarpa TaxID=122646 RepID=A0ABD3GR10_9MARC
MGVGSNQYDELDHPRVGAVREGSLKDPLLVKHELGKVKRSTYDLPDKRFIYGYCNERNPEGVKDVIQHRENERNVEASLLGANWIAMNKLATKKNCATSPEVRRCREMNYIRLLPRTKLANRFKLPSEIDPNHTYGIQGVRDIPMESIMTNAYANDWIDMNNYLKSLHPEPFGYVTPSMEVQPTKASLLRADAAQKMKSKPVTKERFVMKKFQNVPKRVDDENTTALLRDHPEFFWNGRDRQWESQQ